MDEAICLSVIVWTILDLIAIKWNSPSYPWHFSLLAVITRWLVFFSPRNVICEYALAAISPLVLHLFKPSTALWFTASLIILSRLLLEVQPSAWKDFTKRALDEYYDKLVENYGKLNGMIACSATTQTPQIPEVHSFWNLERTVLFVMVMVMVLLVGLVTLSDRLSSSFSWLRSWWQRWNRSLVHRFGQQNPHD